jgi:hypothetical protein
MDELIATYKDHKDFLDKLATEEWEKTKLKKRKEKIEEI